MKRINECSLAKAAVLFIVASALLHTGMPRGRAMIAEPRLKSDSQIRREAGLYDAAIREISRIETMTFARAEDFKPVQAILDRHGPNLRFNRSKLVTIGLGESSFVSAIRSKTSDRTKADEFARELAADNQSIFRIGGAQSIRDKMNRSFQGDISMLRRVSNRLQRAADEIKAKSHHANRSVIESGESSFQRVSVSDVLAAVVVTSLVISVAMIAGGPFAFAAIVYLSATGAGVATAAIIVGAGLVLQRIAAQVGTEEGRDRLAECLESASAQSEQCARERGIFGAPFCLAQYLLSAARCLTAE